MGSACPSLRTNDYRGQPVVLPGEGPVLVYFYPKDGTPGCTREACAFRDAWARYDRAGLRLVGVSADTDAEHRAFAEEHELPFPLVADPEHAWADAFGVGRTLGMDRRVSFLVGGDGRVAKTYDDVDPGVHADQVLSDAVLLGVIPPPAE